MLTAVTEGLPLISLSSTVQRRMSGLERALASLAKSSSAAAVIDSASEDREGLVTCTVGCGVSFWLSPAGLLCTIQYQEVNKVT